MTEKEAKTKRCCGFAYDERQRPLCIGSACMAWRWHPLLMDDAFKNATIKAVAELGDTSNGRHKSVQHVMARRAEYGLPTTPFDGYCGLAGTPTVKEQ